MHLALTECHVPLALESVHPGAHPMSKVHTDTPHKQSSHIHRSASVGVSGITSPCRWCSPSHIEVFHHRKLALVHLSHWLTQTQHTWCPSLVYGQSPPLSMVDSHSYIAQYVIATCIDSDMLGSWLLGKMLYVSVLLSAKEIGFCMTSDVRHWAADLCQLMVLLGSKLME